MSKADGRRLLFVNTDSMVWIKQNAAKFVPPDVGLSNWLATNIAMDALELGCSDVSIRLCSGWVLVTAEANWLNRGAGAGLSVAEAFRSLLPLVLPEKRTSSSPTRHEGWLRVHAQDIMVIDGELAYRIKGDDLPEECHAVATAHPFCVAFRVAGESPKSSATARDCE